MSSGLSRKWRAQGADAFHKGIPRDKNPFVGLGHNFWDVGWLEARNAAEIHSKEAKRKNKISAIVDAIVV